MIQQLMLEKELAATSSWDARKRTFKRHHGVKLDKCAEYGKLEGAVDVRNTIAHGLGRLTRKQALSTATHGHLVKIDVALRNGFLDLEPRHLGDCRVYLTAFLLDVDAKMAHCAL